MKATGERGRRPRGPRLVLSGHLRCGRDDLTVAISQQEIAVGDPDGSSVHADEDVHPVTILPQVPDLHPVEVAWVAQGAYHLFADHGAQLLAPLFIAFRMLLVLLLRWHRFFPDRD